MSEEVIPCAYCRGTGSVDYYRYDRFKNLYRAGDVHCPICAGAGKIRKESPYVTCVQCSGKGTVDKVEAKYLELEKEFNTCTVCKGVGVISETSLKTY